MTTQEVLDHLPTPPEGLSAAGLGLWLAAVAHYAARTRRLAAGDLAEMLIALLAQHCVDHGLNPDVLQQQLAEFVREARQNVGAAH